MKNELSKETSPYLLQHADQPVNWQPWSDSIFEQAQRENKMVFLSIGYSTCHWCHVMAHESFDDEYAAAILNEHFISVKVDREERPDIDATFMAYLQMTTGQGGWPMSLWLSPEALPIVGGTYFPLEDKGGRMGFKKACEQLVELWQEDNNRARNGARQAFAEMQRRANQTSLKGFTHVDEVLAAASEDYFTQFDIEHGGFGYAPKFPRPVALDLLLYQAVNASDSQVGERSLKMLNASLEAMASGGMYDQLGGGFHRYSVDQKWHVPHFEKMLYDQGQLIYTYAIAHVLGNKQAENVVSETFNYLEHVLMDPSGAYISGEDADSVDSHGEKREGAYWTWLGEEIYEVLADPQSAALVCHYFGVESMGNVDPSSDPHGDLHTQNVLYQAHPISDVAVKLNLSEEKCLEMLDSATSKLIKYREMRRPPHKDGKLITAWNAYVLKGLAKAYWIFGKQEYAEAAIRLSEAIYTQLWDGELLYRSSMKGERHVKAFAQDYACLIDALLEMQIISTKWNCWMESLQAKMNALFWREEKASYVLNLEINGSCFFEMVEDYDGAEPSVCAVAYANLKRLDLLFPNQDYARRANEMFPNLMDIASANGFVSPGIVASLHRFSGNPGILKVPADLEKKDRLSLAEKCPNPCLVVETTENEITLCSELFGCELIELR